eukprot:gb/GEZJ01003403.1/.p1 GENE.gb/GEZJ01003403.1/~~gb/GEZJ01003403.1/.p1  ORF type:complete len:477 (+),score=54.58 gb/GEZJ01003403.1/:228-1658(+)
MLYVNRLRLAWEVVLLEWMFQNLGLWHNPRYKDMRVDVSKPRALAQSQVQGYACAPSASASRAGNAGSRGTAQRNIAVPPGVAGAGRSTAAARQEAARIAMQTPTAGIGGGHSDVQRKSQAQTNRVGASHATVLSQGQAQVGAQAEAQQVQADQRRQQYHAQQMAARAQQQSGAAAGMRTNQSGAGAQVDISSDRKKALKQVEAWNSTAVGTNRAVGVTRRSRQRTAAQGVVASGVNISSRATAATAGSVTANQANASATPNATEPKTEMVSREVRGKTKAEVNAPQRLMQIINMVKDVTTQVNCLEQSWEAEAKRQKSERLQITLAALRNSSSASAADEMSRRGQKRKGSLASVENYKKGGEVIETKTIFECSPESGLRLAKKPRHDPGDVQLLREALEMDIKAAKERNPRLDVKVVEEYGHPVVVCMLHIAEVRLPKLTLRVQRGYPRKGVHRLSLNDHRWGGWGSLEKFGRAS